MTPDARPSIQFSPRGQKKLNSINQDTHVGERVQAQAPFFGACNVSGVQSLLCWQTKVCVSYLWRSAELALLA
ncbi:MAG TPA: hypothetical protein PKE64_28345, partial [Anaerolineae bacterium]|nr:hypothetical protein [Anaerolineae bacterium]